MAEKKSDAPHPAEAQLHLAQANCPEEHAAKLVGLGLDWSTLQLVISLARQYGPAAWDIAQQIIARLKGQPDAGPTDPPPVAAKGRAER